MIFILFSIHKTHYKYWWASYSNSKGSKIHAHINLLKDNHPDAKKHLTDVIRLATMLDDETDVLLTDNPKKDYLEFLPLLEAVEPNTIRNILKSAGVGKIQKSIKELLENVYTISKWFDVNSTG